MGATPITYTQTPSDTWTFTLSLMAPSWFINASSQNLFYHNGLLVFNSRTA